MQPDGDGDGEVVHQASEGGPFLVHVDEDFAQFSVVVLTGVDIDLMASDGGFLDVALATVRQFTPGTVALDHLLDNAFGGCG